MSEGRTRPSFRETSLLITLNVSILMSKFYIIIHSLYVVNDEFHKGHFNSKIFIDIKHTYIYNNTLCGGKAISLITIVYFSLFLVLANPPPPFRQIMYFFVGG